MHNLTNMMPRDLRAVRGHDGLAEWSPYVAEYSRILSFQCTQRFTILRKTRSKIFFGTKRPEMVYSGANLLSELKSEIKIFPDADCLLP